MVASSAQDDLWYSIFSMPCSSPGTCSGKVEKVLYMDGAPGAHNSLLSLS